jgi:DNA-binding transcriptional ArsR family regulator
MTTSLIDAVFKALADPTRRAMLDHLKVEPLCTGQLIQRFPVLSRCGVMKHLAVLQEADLVLVRREGRVRWNYLNAIPIMQLHNRWVSKYLGDLAGPLLVMQKMAEAQEKQKIKPDGETDAD